MLFAACRTCCHRSKYILLKSLQPTQPLYLNVSDLVTVLLAERREHQLQPATILSSWQIFYIHFFFRYPEGTLVHRSHTRFCGVFKAPCKMIARHTSYSFCLSFLSVGKVLLHNGGLSRLHHKTVPVSRPLYR